MLLQGISCDFKNTKDRHDIDFISLKVKWPDVYMPAHIPTIEIGIVRIRMCKPSLVTIPKIMNYWLCGTDFQVLLYWLKLTSLPRDSWCHWQCCQIYISIVWSHFCHNILCNSYVKTKLIIHLYTGRILIFQLTAATSSKVWKHDKFKREWSQHYNKCKSNMGQDQVSGGVSILSWLSEPFGNVLWKLPGIW